MADFLRRNSDFVLYLEDYVAARKQRTPLARRLSRFIEGQTLSQTWVGSEAVLKHYSRVWGQIPALRKNSKAASFDEIEPIDIHEFDGPSSDLALVKESGRVWKKRTSGTGGRSREFFFSQLFYLSELFLTHKKIVQFSGLDPNERGFIFLGVNKHKTWQNFVLPDLFNSHQIFGRALFDERSRESIDALWRTIYRVKPLILATRCDYLWVLLQTWNRQDGKPPFKAVALSGSPLDEQTASQASSLWGVTVVDVYALTEFGSVAFKGPGCLAHHIDRSSVFPELMENDDIPEEGDKRLIFSSTSNSTLPLFRYMNGDRGRLLHQSCVCGRLSPLLALTSKKKHGIIKLDSHSYFDLSRLGMLHYAHDAITSISTIEATPTQVVVAIRLRDRISPNDLQRIERAFTDMLPPTLHGQICWIPH